MENDRNGKTRERAEAKKRYLHFGTLSIGRLLKVCYFECKKQKQKRPKKMAEKKAKKKQQTPDIKRKEETDRTQTEVIIRLLVNEYVDHRRLIAMQLSEAREMDQDTDRRATDR
jgi:hypothetical protein